MSFIGNVEVEGGNGAILLGIFSWRLWNLLGQEGEDGI